jgi:hypothetical protein
VTELFSVSPQSLLFGYSKTFWKKHTPRLTSMAHARMLSLFAHELVPGVKLRDPRQLGGRRCIFAILNIASARVATCAASFCTAH